LKWLELNDIYIIDDENGGLRSLTMVSSCSVSELYISECTFEVWRGAKYFAIVSKATRH